MTGAAPLARGLLLCAALLTGVRPSGAVSPARTVLERDDAIAWASARARDRWQGFSYWGPGGTNEVKWDAWVKLDRGQQTRMLLDLFKDVQRNAGPEDQAEDRRAALVLLGQRPLADWAPDALKIQGRWRDELVLGLYLKGYRDPGAEPLGYLAPYARLDRPWTHGLGLHLDRGGRWRFQWIPSPVLMPPLGGEDRLPAALEPAAQPGAILRLARLRPGLERLRALAGGDGGLATVMAQGNRAGFLLRHLGAWLDRAAPALAPLEDQEAWVLHYWAGHSAGGAGTLVYLPRDLPIRTRLALELLKLNPLSAGARVRTASWHGTWGKSVEVTQIRASGGVLNLAPAPEGTFLCDGEEPLRAVLFPGARPTLGERREWCRTALAGMRPDTEVSFWVVPRLGAGCAYELAAARRRETGAGLEPRPDPAMAKAAPCTGAAALALGEGPTGVMFGAVLRADLANPIADPPVPAFIGDAQALTPDQAKGYQADLQRTRQRRERAQALHGQVNALAQALELKGGALYWNGWVAPPPLNPAQKAALAEFQKLRREDPAQAAARQRRGQVGLYGGFGEPGLAPSLALAVAVKPGRQEAVPALVARTFALAFQGQAEKHSQGGVELHRLRTGQAFTPAWALVRGTLVLGSDDGAVQAVAAGLMGQAPTLADRPGSGFGCCRLDGARVAAHLEALLLDYTRAIGHGSQWWWMSPPEGPDDSAAEVQEAFGPFLGAVRGLGERVLDLEWGPWGLEGAAR